MTDNTDEYKRAFIRFIAGGTAGLLECALMHPLDLVKTRFMLQPSPVILDDPKYYTGIIDCLIKMYKTEGALSFWKGILPPLLCETPTKSVRFTAFYHYKGIFSPNEEPSLLKYMLSGYCTGLTESFVICPFEVVKVTQQVDRAYVTHSDSAWAVARMIMKEGGIFGRRGIYRGLGSTMYRHSLLCTFYLGGFFATRKYFPITGRKFEDTCITLALGVCTASLASTINIPFDTVKSRIQAPQKYPIKYRHTWQAIFTMYREEGYLALYNGLLVKVLRLGPGGAIMIVIFEVVNDYLTKIFL